MKSWSLIPLARVDFSMRYFSDGRFFEGFLLWNPNKESWEHQLCMGLVILYAV